MSKVSFLKIIQTKLPIHRKSVIFAEPFLTSGDFEADMKKYFIPFFETIGGVDKDWLKNYKVGKFDE